MGSYFSHKRVRKLYFSSDLFFLVMVRHISISTFYIKEIILRTLLDEELSFEIINEKLTIEVKILWKQHEFLFKKKIFLCYRSQQI